jgi:acetyltransferase-like isoleucine patch superfamily enzyme
MMASLKAWFLVRRALLKLGSEMRKFAYSPFLQTGKHCVLGTGVVIRPADRGVGRLRVTLQGRNTIGNYSVIQGSGTLSMGLNSFCGDFCVFGVNDSISIGRDVMIAQAVTIRDTDHSFDRTDTPMNRQGIQSSPVSIEDDVWIGHGAVILRGVRIGTGSIVSASSVVTRDVPPYTIVGGIPARTLKSRKASDQRAVA